MSKECTRCGVLKPHNDFQVRRASWDGLTASCKLCLAKVDKARDSNANRISMRLSYSKTERGIERGNLAKNNFALRNPKKKSASDMINNAVRDGKLTKMPCEVCGDNYRIHGHHDDYNNPMSVRWLCPKHHKEWHKINGEGINGD